MARIEQKTTYEFIYRSPVHVRRQIPFEEREISVKRVTRYGRNIRAVQVIASMFAPDRDALMRSLGLKLGRRSITETELDGFDLEGFLKARRGHLKLVE